MADEQPDPTTDEAPEAAAEPKPARKRTPAKKPATAEQVADEPEAAVQAEPEATDAPAAEPKGTSRKRTPAKKADPPAEAPVVEKPAAAAPTGPVQVHAHAKYVRTSARKARLVCDHIRGKSVDEAYAILAHTPRHVARDWQKLLRSAVANAEHNHELVGEDLRIASVRADEGPTLKRFRPRAMGRASSIRKRTSHLSITLAPKE